MNSPFVIKICNKCKKILIAYKGNFREGKGGKYGLRSICRECEKEERIKISKIKKKIKEKGNPFDNIDVNKTWNNCPFVIKVCSKCGEILVANEINFFRKGKRFACQCKKCCKKWEEDNKEYRKSYREEFYKNNKEILKERHENWKKNNPNYYKEYDKKYRENNKEHCNEINKQWRKNNPDKIFNYHHNRRTRLENQGKGITKEQWKEMMEFFEWKCAYSGEYLGGNNNDKKRTIDHIIPLNKEGLNEIWNLVPMIKSYNDSKGTKDMVEWYKQQEFFDIDRLMKIYEWQEYAFEKWSKY